MILHQAPEFFGFDKRTAILELLKSNQLEWERSDRLGRTTTGRVWQLAGNRMHLAPEIIRISTWLADAVYDEVGRVMPDLLPDSTDLVPQVFPVRMEGHETDSPAQAPHIDGSAESRPVVTALYYAEAADLVGGALRLHGTAPDGFVEVAPQEDQLLVIAGDQIHSVQPLTRGRRTTVVTNFYDGRNL